MEVNVDDSLVAEHQELQQVLNLDRQIDSLDNLMCIGIQTTTGFKEFTYPSFHKINHEPF